MDIYAWKSTKNTPKSVFRFYILVPQTCWSPTCWSRGIGLVFYITLSYLIRGVCNKRWVGCGWLEICTTLTINIGKSITFIILVFLLGFSQCLCIPKLSLLLRQHANCWKYSFFQGSTFWWSPGIAVWMITFYSDTVQCQHGYNK